MVQTLIRDMQPNDVSGIASWMVDVPLWQTYQLTSDKIIQQLNHAIETNESLYVIEYIEKEAVIGFAWILRRGMFGRSPYLKQIGIHPDHTGEGFGKQLLAYIEDQCKHYATDIFLLASDFNTEAHKFYIHHGYQHVGTIPNYILPDVAEYLFYKRF